MKLKKLREERAALAKKANDLLDKATAENRNLTADENEQFDAIHAEIDAKKGQIDRIERQENLDAELRGTPGEIPYGTNPPSAENRQTSGDRVTVLRSDQSFADHLRQTRGTPDCELDGLSFGGMVRAMVLGPSNAAERRALSEGTDSAGGYTVPEILSGQLLDRLRTKATVFRAGARTIPLQSDVTKIAKIATDPTAAWRLENGAVAESDPTFSQLTFTPRSLAVLVKVSRELLEDSGNLDSALQTVFSKALALEVDRVALLGTGVAPEPRGIKETVGIGSVSMGDNGAALTNYDPFLDALLELQDANAADPTAAIMAPRTARVLAGLKDTTNQPLMRPKALENLPFMATTQMPVDETQGTAEDASSILLGDFSELLVGVRSDLRVEVSRELFIGNLQYAFVAHLRADIQVAHPASFCEVVGIIPAA